MYIMTFSSLILSYNLLGALRECRVLTVCNFGVFSPRCCAWKSAVYVSPVHGLRDQCSSCSISSGHAAGRECWQFHGSVCCSMAPSELLPSLWRGAGAVQAPVSVSSACGRHKWPGHRTPLGLGRISTSAKVASLTLPASSLSVLPWASCKAEEMLFFSVFCLSHPEGSPGLVAQTAQ